MDVADPKRSEPHTDDFRGEEHTAGVAAGRLPEDVYTNYLSWWRAALRRKCVAVVERESEVIAKWQARVRSPWLDTYFLHSSMLGTHTFFLVFLPLFFFFGYFELGRGLCYALAFGVYLSSLLKDMVCSPRPYSPPVARLTVGSHHLEYGLPSTHSTNCMSMALFLGAHVYDLHRAGSISTISFATWVVFLVLYVSSIVGSRLYTGMHGFLDVSAGVILGITAWMLQRLVMPEVERWITHSGWTAPLTVTLVCLLLVNQHPSPVDDCPCFEDAIAFVSVILGQITSLWFSKRLPALNSDLFTSKTPGGAFDSPFAITTWMFFALLKLTTGISIIFAWRMLAKPTVQTLLPPLFRWLAHASPVRLPHRRHYTPATEYSRGPPHTLRAVPSMIDLDLAVAELVDEDSGGVASGREGRTAGVGAGAFKRRGLPSEDAQEKAVVFEVRVGGTLEDDDKVKHYDADVLTRVVVYAGIGTLSAVLVPAMFEALEWGV
jgi:membrane-associated phospholipid phosphatase